MSHTDHHLRSEARSTRFDNACRIAGVVHYAGFKQAMRSVVMPKRKAIAEQVADMQDATPFYLGADLRNVSECLDMLDDLDHYGEFRDPREDEDEDDFDGRGYDALEPVTHSLFEKTHDVHRGANSSIRHLMVCNACLTAYEDHTEHEYSGALPRPNATGFTRWLTDEDLEDLMDAHPVCDLETMDAPWHVETPNVDLVGGTWGSAKTHDYDPAKTETYRVWELARMLGVPSIVAIIVLRDHLHEYVRSASSTVVKPAARRLAEAIEHEADQWLPLLNGRDWSKVTPATNPSESALDALRTLMNA